MELNSCRVCLESNDSELSLLFSLSHEVRIADLISFSCGINIDPTDTLLPQNICNECLQQIKAACDIKKKCWESEQVLREKLKISSRAIQDSPESGESGSFTIRFLNPNEIDLPNKVIDQEFEEEDCETEKSEEVQTKSKKTQKSSKRIRSKNKKPEEQDYKCFICDRMFDLISSKDLHVKQDHVDVKVCKLCHKRKQTPIALETHLRYHFFGFRFLCSSCGKSFRFKNLLENHLNVEHYNNVKFSCDLCQYSSKFKINLERHVKSVHMKLKNFLCDKPNCDHQYSTQVGLNLHLYRVHGVAAPVNCSDCLQGFTFESELRVHKKHCTGSTIRMKKARPQDAAVDILDVGFRCRVCLQVFETRSKWSVHFHHKHKNTNVCAICNKQMASSTSLFKHIQVQHNNIKKYQCDICTKTFGFKHSLESHKNTHTGEKPFSCNICNFRSGDRSTISKHKKKMHGHDQPQLI